MQPKYGLGVVKRDVQHAAIFEAGHQTLGPLRAPHYPQVAHWRPHTPLVLHLPLETQQLQFPLLLSTPPSS